MGEKAQVWIDRGVRLVGLSGPSAAPSTSGPLAPLRGGDHLDGGDVVPGFSLPLVALW